MKLLRDEVLLRRFRLCRADMIAALGISAQPPDARTLRDLADLQLAIMATEGAIHDKTDACFVAEYSSELIAERKTGYELCVAA